MSLCEQFKTNLKESSKSFELWKSQVDSKNEDEILKLYSTIIRKINRYENSNIKHNDYFDLLDKLNYLEAKYGLDTKLGLELK